MANEAVSERREIPGLTWALVMLALQVTECLVLIEVIFHDRAEAGLGAAAGFGALELYLSVVATTVVLQTLGILLVWRGYRRPGGALQIVASSPHLIKAEGIIGIIGGLRAWRYATA